MDASFHGGSNDTIDTGKLFFGGAVETGDKVAQRHWRIESPANIS